MKIKRISLNGEPPLDEPVLIYAPTVLGPRWHKAVLKRLKGRFGYRWEVFDYPGLGNVSKPVKGFQPDAWREIE